jgi:hypothetical protein
MYAIFAATFSFKEEPHKAFRERGVAMDQFTAAFKDGPKTEINAANGQVSVTVEARHLRPEDAMGADFLGVLGVFALVGIAIWIAFETREIVPVPVILFLAGLFCREYFQKSLREAMQVTATLCMTEDTIFLKPAPLWKPVTEWERFDRRHPHRFVLLAHDRAQEELDQHEYKRRTSPETRNTRYYSDSWIVVLEYLGQRHDVCEVMGARQAKAILARLTLCDEYMNGVVNFRKRLPMTPADQWQDQTGSVPQ